MGSTTPHKDSLGTILKHSACCRRKLENWSGDTPSPEIRVDVKPGEEPYLQHLIRFCYTRTVELNAGQLCFQLNANIWYSAVCMRSDPRHLLAMPSKPLTGTS